MNEMDFKNWLKHCEGYSDKPYMDTVEKITIGWGRNLSDNGISVDEAELMFQNDLKRALTDLNPFPWFVNSPENVQAALVNMSFNLGITRLLGFKRMIAAINEKNYTLAAREALDSKWASQVGRRATDIALMIIGAKDEPKV